MRPEELRIFNEAISSLKLIEPSQQFEKAFRDRLADVSAMKYGEPVLNRLVGVLAKAFNTVRVLILEGTAPLARLSVVFALFISVGFYVYIQQPTQPNISYVAGNVMVRSHGDRVPRHLIVTDTIRKGDEIETGEGSVADIVLDNNYAVRVRESSAICVVGLTPKVLKGKAEFKLLKGGVLASVEKGFSGSKFIINTDSAVATALGTKFSMDCSGNDRASTKVSVLQGQVKVEGRKVRAKAGDRKRVVMVDAGQKTTVSLGDAPSAPQRLIEEEWAQLDELYQLGRRPQVMLLVSNRSDRAKQLLKPCPIYITDEKPRTLPPILEEAIASIGEAVRSSDRMGHIKSVRMLERITDDHPNPRYDVQLMLYCGAYYEYLSLHEEAIRVFTSMLKRYPDSPLASVAQCAIGIIYEEGINDPVRSREAYSEVLNRYPNSLEALWAEEKLGIKK